MITFLDSPGGNVMGVQLGGAVAADDYRQLEEALVEHLNEQHYVDPVENQTHYVLMIKGARNEVFITTSRVKLQERIGQLYPNQRYTWQAFGNRRACRG